MPKCNWNHNCAALALGAACALSTDSSAVYTLTPLSDGASARVVSEGTSFDLEVVLSSDDGDTHTSSILRLLFTSPGLILEALEWVSPYTTGGLFDFSVPAAAELPAPIVDSTLPSPPGLIDIELSNIVFPGEFGEGPVARLTIGVPADWLASGGAAEVFILAQPDTVADGFDEIATSAGPGLAITIVPAPATAMPALLFVVMLRRRSRRRGDSAQ